jgi:mRNA interferase MazF
VTSSRRPSRGEIWDAQLDPTRGHEQAGRRPVLVVSTDQHNHGPAQLIYAIPLTRTPAHSPFHVPIDPPEGGLVSRSYALCDAMRSLSLVRFAPGRRGVVSRQTMAIVEDALRILLEL